MTDNKRQPVPRVPPVKTRTRSTAHLPGEFPFTEIPKSGPVPKPANNHSKEKNTMSNTPKKIKNLVVDNQDAIKHKLLVAAGAATGLILTGVLVNLFNRPSTTNNIVIIEDGQIDEPNSSPLEP